MVRCSVGNSTRDSQGNKYHINSPPLSRYPEAVFWALATFTAASFPAAALTATPVSGKDTATIARVASPSQSPSPYPFDLRT